MREIDREARAIEFYDLLSSFDFMSSTPTLFNSGTLRPQLSSCFLTTVPDDLDGIFKSIKDNALLSKYSGGLGNDWTRVRGLGAHIKGTNGESQGVVPFLKVANDTAIAVNQGGKRKGAVCAYLETWHIDIEEFLDLRKNTGDDRRRTHDMNTANWVPDLFMQRVEADGDWTLFSPDETPDLHDLYGPPFAERYAAYEAKAARGEMTRVQAGSRRRSVAPHADHAVRDRPSLDHLQGPLQPALAAAAMSASCTPRTCAPRSRSTPPTTKSRSAISARSIWSTMSRRRPARSRASCAHRGDRDAHARQRHRHQFLHHPGSAPLQPAAPPGRPRPDGLPGCAADAAHRRMASDAAVDLRRREHGGDRLLRDLGLGRSRGRARTLSVVRRLAVEPGHPADRLDRDCSTEARGGASTWTAASTLDWDAPARSASRSIGMRNSNIMAIAPTATISNICGVSQSIEPAYQNLYVKSNMSGDFTVVNAYLVRDLKARGLWDEVMVSDLKYFDGSVGAIDRVPDDLKALYATAFEIDAAWLIEAAARRQKWIDQAQSLNLYIANPERQEARRALPAGLGARPEDDLLPALAQRDACREVDAEGHRRQAQCRASRRDVAAPVIACAVSAGSSRGEGVPRSTIPNAKPASKQQEQGNEQCSTGQNSSRAPKPHPPRCSQTTPRPIKPASARSTAAAAASRSTTSG